LPGAAARAVCWNAVIDMVRQGELPLPEFAAMLAAIEDIWASSGGH
jgi:hypothetical protein